MMEGNRPAASRLRLALLLPVLLAFTACASIERMALPKASLADTHWRDHDRGAVAAVDHGPWDRFLGRYVVTDAAGVNRLRYASVTEADKKALAAYIKSLAAAPVSRLSRDGQLAFWIDLYNALTVNLVLDHYPVSSVRKIKPGFFSIGPWDMKLVSVEGRPLSLNDIEHRILRPLWGDARLHYALNCAAVGCPDLAAGAYTAENTEQRLEAGARAYINNPRGVAFDDKGRLVLSKIYIWFCEDFGGTTEGVLKHLRHYAAPALQARLTGSPRIGKYRYDWSLNDAGGK